MQVDQEISEESTPLQATQTLEEGRVAIAVNQDYPPITLLGLFVMLSVFGWLFELSFFLLNDHVLINPGTLHGPWLPIYGVCGTLMLILLKRWRSKPAVSFLLIIGICGAVETVTGHAIFALSGVSWWDYTNFTFNIGKYICLEALLAFGLFGMVLIYAVAPKFAMVLERIPIRAKQIFLIVVLTVFALDAIYSLFYPNYAAAIVLSFM